MTSSFIPSVPNDTPPKVGKVCRKRSYPSAKVAKRRNRRASFRVRAYRCPSCGWWHVTNQDKR